MQKGGEWDSLSQHSLVTYNQVLLSTFHKSLLVIWRGFIFTGLIRLVIITSSGAKDVFASPVVCLEPCPE
jgi:hypothetical protein